MSESSQQPTSNVDYSKSSVKSAAIEPTSDNVRWSYSKRSKFEQCSRAYYYTYFGAGNKQDPLGKRIQFLKNLPNRYLNPGSIAHLVIKTFFRKAQQGDIWKPDRLVSWGLKMLQDNIDYSRRNPDGSHLPSTKYPPKLLMEYYYGFEDVESLYIDSKTRLQQALSNFAFSQSFETFRLHGRKSDALIEEWIELNLLPNVVVAGQVDLAYRDNDLVTIVDWKIGADDSDGEDSLQLATYALWAAEHFGCHSEQIRVYKAFLGSEKVVSFVIDESKLEATKARILQDAGRMATLEGYGNRGVTTAFTPCYQSGICRNCPFQELCYD